MMRDLYHHEKLWPHTSNERIAEAAQARLCPRALRSPPSALGRLALDPAWSAPVALCG